MRPWKLELIIFRLDMAWTTSLSLQQDFKTELINRTSKWSQHCGDATMQSVQWQRKLILLGIIEVRQEAGESSRSCCRDLVVQPLQVRRWRPAKQDNMSNPEAAHRRLLHVGRQSVLAPVEEQLLIWFFKLCEQGFMVSVQLLTLKACKVSAAFWRKTERAKDLALALLQYE